MTGCVDYMAWSYTAPLLQDQRPAPPRSGASAPQRLRAPALQLLQHLPFGNLPLDSAPCDSAPTASGLPNDGASANDAADDAVVADGAHAPEGCVLGGGVGAGMVRGIVHARASPPRQTPRSREVLQDVLATRLAEAALLEAVRGRRRLRPLRALLTRAHRL